MRTAQQFFFEHGGKRSEALIIDHDPGYVAPKDGTYTLKVKPRLRLHYRPDLAATWSWYVEYPSLHQQTNGYVCPRDAVYASLRWFPREQ